MSLGLSFGLIELVDLNLEMRIIMNFESSLLNKLTVTQTNTYFRDIIEEYDKKLKEEINSGGNPREIVINKFLNSLDETNPKDEKKLIDIDDTIFSFLFFQDQDTYYHRRISGEVSADDIIAKLQLNDHCKKAINRKIFDVENDLGIVTIRKKSDDVLILFNYGTYVTAKRMKEKQFLVSCRINCSKNIISIGFKDSAFSKIKEEHKKAFGIKRNKLIKDIITKITNLKLDINIKSFKEEVIESTLYKMFVSESEKAIDLIRTKVEDADKENRNIEQLKIIAEDFLKTQFLLKNPEGFVEKALDLKYQDFAEQMEISNFINNGGYIFGFSFVEKQVTRSDNKSDKREPIYKYKLFWNLKDIIDEYLNLSQLSMYWKFNKYDSDKTIGESDDEHLTFVEVDYKSINDELVLHYFVNSDNQVLSTDNADDAKRREDYALQQIIRYLPA